MLDTLYASNTAWGSEAIPVASGQFGGYDQMRLQEAAAPGMAVSYRNSTDGSKYLEVFKFGNASARAEFLGVLWTKGASPTMSTAATANNADGKFIVFSGYCPITLAPGYAVRAGQYLEPIPSGTYQAMWRPVTAGGHGVAWATQGYDNSGGSQGKWIGAVIEKQNVGAGLLGSDVTGSTTVTSVAVRTAYSKTVTIPANTIKVGDRYRITFGGRSLNNADNTHLFELWLNGVTVPSGALLTSQAFAAAKLTSGAFFRGEAEVEIVSATTMEAKGSVLCKDASSASGTAGAVGTLDITADNIVTVSVTPGGASANDQTKLDDIAVVKLN